MNSRVSQPQADVWSDWLLHTRYADDPGQEQVLRAKLEQYASRVLDGACLTSGMTLADIGAGDGLIGFSAIDRIGPSLRVLLTDISAPLLRHTEAVAEQRNVRDQCAFIQCSAELLDGIENGSVDAATTRAVLAYVSDKPAALQECYRILKPGGRLSIAEPIMRDDAIEASSLRQWVEGLPDTAGDNFLHLLHRWKSAQFPDTEAKIAASPIANYGERDLVRFVLDAGFVDVHMEFHIDVRPTAVTSWEVLLGSSPHPWAPRLGDILATQFTADERHFFEQILRPQIEGRQLVTAERTAYLTALKPPG
ncbi:MULTISPECIES: class I SAM-dependent methyltransferase [Paraburkholderia]|uniref:Ubiquinone/menaquinone biosynthesis C-methylase UbiE n=2 Tax=Paraburkholderia TaxID=1822464 RepID=A0A7Z0B8T4_9BURK|nr:class I SAM-dependent methyltransferase [Paraburkholderia bryophila]NYH15631.1 ubiquinone/menaquinone biosynthesis C-methylase UbiE [Paraburkholderia bryophila]NYH25926.1 ubiquinone/menaquinone biosynthesis C-methylase UbiE [Paraburkholderia bryophila]